MKFYAVKLKIRSGEYEKSATTLRHAESENEACALALLGECHGSLEDGTAEWVDGGISDMNWEFYYSVISCQVLTPEDAMVLQKYL